MEQNKMLIIRWIPELFLVMVCAGLLSACATTKWEKSTITIGWDAPTSLSDGAPIPEDVAIKYNVYIDRDTDNTHDDKELLTDEPISETSYTIDSIETKGSYFIGIQTIAERDKGGKLYDEPKMSRIAWSYNEADTESGPFGIKVE
jgi:hypothetical protein